MHWSLIFLATLIGFVICIYIFELYFPIRREGFEGTAAAAATAPPVLSQDEQELNDSMVFLSEAVCEAMAEIKKSFTQNYQGDSAAESKALVDMSADAGKLFATTAASAAEPMAILSCPFPTEASRLPADIDVQLTNTVLYANVKTKQLLNSLQDSLACKETFADLCTPEQEEVKAKEAAAASAKECKSVSSLSDEEKSQLVNARLLLVKRILASKEIESALIEIKQTVQKLKEIKQKAESGELKPSCGG